MVKQNQTISLYHPNHGVVEYSRTQFIKLYELTQEGLYKLVNKKRHSHRGWVLAENQDKYQSIMDAIPNPDLLTLTHNKYGTYTLLTTEFIEKFGISQPSLSSLKCGRILECKGWRVPGDLPLSQGELKQLLKLLERAHKQLGLQKPVLSVWEESGEFTLEGEQLRYVNGNGATSATYIRKKVSSKGVEETEYTLSPF